MYYHSTVVRVVQEESLRLGYRLLSELHAVTQAAVLMCPHRSIAAQAGISFVKAPKCCMWPVVLKQQSIKLECNQE